MYPNHRENTFLEMVGFFMLYLLFSESKIFTYCYQQKLLVVKSHGKREDIFFDTVSMFRAVSSVQKGVEPPSAREIFKYALFLQNYDLYQKSKNAA